VILARRETAARSREDLRLHSGRPLGY
jgi:hypothetical protein